MLIFEFPLDTFNSHIDSSLFQFAEFTLCSKRISFIKSFSFIVSLRYSRIEGPSAIDLS